MRVKEKAPQACQREGRYTKRHNRILAQRRWERSCAAFGIVYFLTMLFVFLGEIGVW